jgi:hypothetical protein
MEIHMTNVISWTPATVAVSGKTKSDRQLSVLTVAPAATLAALGASNGKLGKAARVLNAREGIKQIVTAMADANYRPLVAYVVGVLGETITVTNWASAQSLPDRLEDKIAKAKSSKSGGYVTDKKTGAQKPNATLSTLLALKSDVTECLALAAEIVAQRKAEREAQKSIAA